MSAPVTSAAAPDRPDTLGATSAAGSLHSSDGSVHEAGASASPPAAGPPHTARDRRWWRRPLVLALLLLAGIVAYLGLTFLQVWRSSRHDGARPAQAIVVLGAAQYDGRPSPVLEARLDHALELYERDLAPTIVVTGGRQAGDRFTEATAGYNYLRARGVPDDAILKEVQGESTYESLAATARFLRSEGIDDVVLVSSPAHAERLSGIARDVGLHAAVSPTDGGAPLRELARETLGVAAGRLVGYRRLDRLIG